MRDSSDRGRTNSCAKQYDTEGDMRRRQLDLMIVIMFCLLACASYGQVPQRGHGLPRGTRSYSADALYRVKPEYTDEGRRAGISGVVEVGMHHS